VWLLLLLLLLPMPVVAGAVSVWLVVVVARHYLGEGGRGVLVRGHEARVEYVEVVPEGGPHERVVAEEAVAAPHAHVGQAVGRHPLHL
jgi:hypothetical protein